jgi:uncharacterized protein DUF5753
MPNQLRSVADRAERDSQVTVRVLPFAAGAHSSHDPFTLLGFEGALSDVLYLDPGWDRAMDLITGDVPEVAEAARVLDEVGSDSISRSVAITSRAATRK